MLVTLNDISEVSFRLIGAKSQVDVKAGSVRLAVYCCGLVLSPEPQI